jgi:hypothetical protein
VVVAAVAPLIVTSVSMSAWARVAVTPARAPVSVSAAPVMVQEQ